MKERVKTFLKLYSLILIPFESPNQFLDLQYKKIQPNKVHLNKTVSIEVDSSASPLFYRFEKPRLINKIDIQGSIEISKAIKNKEDDSYFQIGVIYEGDYRPSSFVRAFLPEWLLKVIDLNKKTGVGQVDFYSTYQEGEKFKIKSQSVREIKLNFYPEIKLNSKNEFNHLFTPKNHLQKVIGLWFRADGDDSQAKFKSHIIRFKAQ